MNCYYFYNLIEPKSKETMAIMFEHYNSPNNEIVLLDFHKLFLNLDTNAKKILDSLYEYSNNKINLISYKSFLTKYNLKCPVIEESYITNNNQNMNYEKRKKLFNIEPKPVNVTLKSLFPYLSDNRKYLMSVKKISYSNSIEFILSLIYCLCSCNNTTHIKKCKVCEGYFVATHKSNIYCSRQRLIKNKPYSCDEFVKNFKQQPKYRKFKEQDDSFLEKINIKSNLPYDYKEKYIQARNDKIAEAIKENNLNLLKNFSLNYEKQHPFN